MVFSGRGEFGREGSSRIGADGSEVVKAIILLGAPGAGKGTIAEGIRAASPFVHISTGDMLREAVKAGSPVGKKAEAFMKRGELVPDGVIIDLVDERLDHGESDAAYMFDGFPRTLEQARLMDDSLGRRGAKVDFVFLLDAPRELLIARLTGRRICRQCGQGYHVINIPPKKNGICDLCGGELYQRTDDQESTILNRLDVYVRQTESLISFYEKKGVLVKVDSSKPRQETVKEVLSATEALTAT
jgi:adenylate kinase